MALALLIVAPSLQAAAQTPTTHFPRISVREVAAIPQTDNQHPIRIAQNPADQELYVLASSGVLYQLSARMDDTFSPVAVLDESGHGTPGAVGMAFAGDGTLFLLGNEDVGSERTRFVLRRGSIDGAWSTVASSEPYLLSHTWFDHRANGLAVSPDGSTLYLNSGARTDHGEMYGGVREEGLTAVVLQVPADATDLVLPNDRVALRSGGYVFASGIRNSFDLEFAPNGDLMAADNAGDRDDSEEFNWIREGHHYGFPWRIGTSDTPQQYAGYDPSSDLFVQPDRNSDNVADTGWYFSNDPTFPAPPAGVTFTDPIPNAGPFADKFRIPETGEVADAGDLGQSIGSFTSHRSPLGLVFDADSVLTGSFNGGAFMASWNSEEDQLLARLGGTGEDLLHLNLEKSQAEYSMTVERVASGFDHPIDAAMVGNVIYVLEYGTPFGGGGGRRSVQAVTLPGRTNLSSQAFSVAPQPQLDVYPNPGSGIIRVRIDQPIQAGTIELIDVLGRVVLRHQLGLGGTAELDAGFLPIGVYLARARFGETQSTRLVTIAR